MRVVGGTLAISQASHLFACRLSAAAAAPHDCGRPDKHCVSGSWSSNNSGGRREAPHQLATLGRKQLACLVAGGGVGEAPPEWPESVIIDACRLG